MSEPRRWTLYEFPEMASTALPVEAYRGGKHPGDAEGVEVMPVSEHEALRESATAVLEHFPMASPYHDALRAALKGTNDGS